MAERASPQSDDLIAITPHFRLQWEEAQQAYVLLYPEGMVKLNAASAEILKRCSGDRCVAEIIEDLQKQFPEDDIEVDVLEFLEVAYEKGWVRTKRAG
ncbi:MAG: pyrroloquinoline quinone biosynthesis peptide chaperone PqqD [Lysobacterales bacterium]